MTPILIPPGVCGRERGSITISIDEVFWSGTSQGEIYVKFSWWGSDEVYEFYPKDLTKVSGKSKTNSSDKTTSYTFPVGTSVRLLGNYFSKWKNMGFNVYRISDKRLLGCVQVENWECILAESKFSSYFAILDKKGTRLGDLHIVFCLKMKKKKYKLKSDFPVGRELQDDVWGAGDNGVLADLVSRGQELRKDMVKSVLSTCETKDLEEVVEEKTAVGVSTEEMERKAKLVDFLMGKELTEPEKEIAMNTLRCTSPTDSILDVAATIGDELIQINRAVNEDTFHKKFCSVGEKKVVSAEEKHFDERGDRNRLENNDQFKETQEEIPDLRDFRLEKFPRQSLGGNQKAPRINSFKITFGVMTLTALGLKKVCTSPTIKPLNNKIRSAKSPGIVFSLETVVPYVSKSKAAVLKPLTMSSKAFGGTDVVFNESIIQKLRLSRDPAWLKVCEHISGLPIKVYWRCLNQRLPSLLGQCLLPDDIFSEDFESSFPLNVQMANQQVAAVLACKIELGALNVFGNELLGDDKKRKKTRLDSMLPQLSEVPPSRASVLSDKTPSRDCSKESFSFPPPPVPPPSSRCQTASSATSTNIRDPLESDHHLMDAISNLNEKLTKKSAHVRLEDVEENAKDKDNEKSKPTSARSEEPKPQTFDAGKLSAGIKDVEGGACQDKSPRRGCCCCCRGCPGDCKRRKSVRKKHLRDRRPLSHRGLAGKHDEQTSTVSNSEGGMSPGDQEILDQVNAYLRGSRFHSPPTKLTQKHRHTVQGTRAKEASNQSKNLDALFADNLIPRDFAKSKTRNPEPPYRGDPKICRKDFVPRTPEHLPSVHRFSINVYSSDAQIFYREGEMELYMAYRFPQADPVSGKLFCPAEVSSIELSGDAAPVTHYLPLSTSLSEALLSYPKQNVTFHIWARAYMYEKRDFLIGQAKLPLEKLVEWEAAHIYSQKRRTDHPLLPPDKHFVNLRIHPSKGELPQHLEPGRIAQLGLEIDYEKFRDVGGDSFDRLPRNLAPLTDSPPVRPYYGHSHGREEVSDLSTPYLNARSERVNDPGSWRNQAHDRGGSSDPHWGVRMLESGAADLRMHPSSKFESVHKTRLDGLDERDYLANINKTSDDELMLILGGREDPNDVPSERSNPYSAPRPERHGPDGDQLNGSWGDENLQYQSISRLDPVNTSEFVPDPESHQRLQSPRVDRDFPAGVVTADFSSANNSVCQTNPFEVPVTVHAPPKNKPSSTRLRVENQSSPLPALARVIDPHFGAKEPSPILDSSFELGSESKATQTTVNGQVAIDLFSVRIEVEAAINLLPSIQDGVHCQPSSRVEFDAWSKGREMIVQSSVINSDANPKYDSAWNVELPAYLLYKGESEFELRVVNVDDGTISSAFIDLTTLSAGLPSIDGWYFLSSHGHKSAGQVKVSITPLESIRKYRDEWIEEFRKRKHEPNRCIDDRISCESTQRIMLNDSNSSTKFKEKMKELEQLTERMKRKLMNAEQWNDSPPCTLMREVNDFAQQLVEETRKSVDDRTKTSRKHNQVQSSTPSQGLPELDMRTVQEFCPVDSDVDHDYQPKTCPANVPPSFLGYIPHSRIRKPFTKALSASREKFEDSDDSAGFLGRKLSLDKCQKELQQLPKDSLDAASIAIEQMIADLRNQKVDDSKS